MSRPALLASMAVVLLACASTGSGGGRNPELITLEEVMGSDVSNAYELVERLRPRWLTSRGDRSQRLETVIVVYLDQALLGGLETLRGIPRSSVGTIRVLSAAEAGALAGQGSRHVERALVVTSRTAIR